MAGEDRIDAPGARRAQAGGTGLEVGRVLQARFGFGLTQQLLVEERQLARRLGRVETNQVSQGTDREAGREPRQVGVQIALELVQQNLLLGRHPVTVHREIRRIDDPGAGLGECGDTPIEEIVQRRIVGEEPARDAESCAAQAIRIQKALIVGHEPTCHRRTRRIGGVRTG